MLITATKLTLEIFTKIINEIKIFSFAVFIDDGAERFVFGSDSRLVGILFYNVFSINITLLLYFFIDTIVTFFRKFEVIHKQLNYNLPTFRDSMCQNYQRISGCE